MNSFFQISIRAPRDPGSARASRAVVDAPSTTLRAPPREFQRRRDGHFKTGQRFSQVVMLMRARGGFVRPSDLVEQLGMRRDLAEGYLRRQEFEGRLTKLPPGPLPLKPGKWEPLYQLNLNL